MSTGTTPRQIVAGIVLMTLRKIESHMSNCLRNTRARNNPDLFPGNIDESLSEDEDPTDTGASQLADMDEFGPDADVEENFIDRLLSGGATTETAEGLSDYAPSFKPESKFRKLPLKWVCTKDGGDVYPVEHSVNFATLLTDDSLVSRLLDIRIKPKPVDYGLLEEHEAGPVSSITSGANPKVSVESYENQSKRCLRTQWSDKCRVGSET